MNTYSDRMLPVLPQFLPQLASTADWLSAWSTLFAAAGTVFTFGAVLWTNRLASKKLQEERAERKQDIARLDAEHLDAEMAQARLVRQWRTAPGTVLGRRWKRSLLRGGWAGTRGTTLRVEVRNDSDKPIYDVTACLYLRGPDGAPRRQSRLNAEHLDRIGPHSDASLSFTGSEPAPRSPDQKDGDLFEIDIMFTDAVGLRWIRRGKAQPARYIIDDDKISVIDEALPDNADSS